MSTELMISTFYKTIVQNTAVKLKVNQKEIQLISDSQGTRKHFGSEKEGKDGNSWEIVILSCALPCPPEISSYSWL